MSNGPRVPTAETQDLHRLPPRRPEHRARTRGPFPESHTLTFCVWPAWTHPKPERGGARPNADLDWSRVGTGRSHSRRALGDDEPTLGEPRP